MISRSLILFRVLFLRAKTTNWFTNSRIIWILLREMRVDLWENSFMNAEIVQVFQMVHFGMGNLVQHKVSALYSILTSFLTPTIFCGLPTARSMSCRRNDVRPTLTVKDNWSRQPDNFRVSVDVHVGKLLQYSSVLHYNKYIC